MNAQAWSWSKECVMPSRMDEAHALIDEIMEQLNGKEWDGKELFAINLALEEALVNAVQHGNNSDPEKVVRFRSELGSDRVYFRIEDEGEGFDPNAVPDPTDPEHIMVASGRGVLLIRSFVSRAWWNDRGNVLEFEKDRAK